MKANNPKFKNKITKNLNFIVVFRSMFKSLLSFETDFRNIKWKTNGEFDVYKHGDLPALDACLRVSGACPVVLCCTTPLKVAGAQFGRCYKCVTKHPRWLKNRPFAFRNGMIPARCAVRRGTNAEGKAWGADTSRIQGDVPVIFWIFGGFSQSHYVRSLGVPWRFFPVTSSC